MSDLVQEIASAVVKVARPTTAAEANELYEAIRQVITRQERGEAVAWMTDDGRVCSDLTKREAMSAVAQAAYCIPLYAHPTPDAGRVAELESQLAESAKCAFEYAAKVGELERRLAESREREGRLEQMNKWHRDAARTVVSAFDLLPPGHAARFSPLNINTLREVLAADKEQNQ